MKKTPISSDERITDKAFSQSLLISTISILLCIVALCSMTYAWFSTENNSGNNLLQSGHFGLSVSVVAQTDGTTDAEPLEISVTEEKGGALQCVLPQAGSYTVTLSMTEETTVTKGYCSVSANGSTFKTALVSKDPTLGVEPFCFTVVVDAETVLTFLPKWGIPAESEITHNAELVLPTPAE